MGGRFKQVRRDYSKENVRGNFECPLSDGCGVSPSDGPYAIAYGHRGEIDYDFGCPGIEKLGMCKYMKLVLNNKIKDEKVRLLEGELEREEKLKLSYMGHSRDLRLKLIEKGIALD